MSVWARLLHRPADRAGLRVSYGLDTVPSEGARVGGGTAKLQRLASRFPHRPSEFTLLYLSSSGLPRDLGVLLRLARWRGVPVVVNQDGVGYPAWAGSRWEDVNRPLRSALQAANHVLYQTAFCKEDADRYLGEAPATWEILPNAVDTERFRPSPSPPEGPPVLLIAGNQTSAGRLRLALATLECVRERHPGVRLLVTGDLPGHEDERLSALVREGAVDHVGAYSQAAAPELFRRAHILLHTKVLDPCPNVVLEALASGLPVVHPASGGTPELVGDAGVAVPHEISHERLSLPAPAAMAQAVESALADHARLAVLARARAVQRFPLDRWLDRHAELFADLLERRPAR